MSELDSDIKRPSSLIDGKFRTEKGCPDELAQLRQLLHQQIVTAQALDVALPATYSQPLIPLPSATSEVNRQLLQNGQMRPATPAGR